MKNTKVAFLSAVAVAAGCAAGSTGCFAGHAGREFDVTHANDVKNGQTRDQIRAWFGEPYMHLTFAPNAKGCVERWTYTYAKSQNASTHGSALVVDFGPNGAVCDESYAVIDR